MRACVGGRSSTAAPHPPGSWASPDTCTDDAPASPITSRIPRIPRGPEHDPTMRTRQSTRTRPAGSAPRNRPLPLHPLPADAPDPVRAVSLGLALLKTARVEAWDDLIAALRDDHEAVTSRLATVDLTGDDLALLDAHLDLLSQIRVVPVGRGRGGHTVTVAVCDTCGRWMLSTGATSRRASRTRSGVAHDLSGGNGDSVVTANALTDR